jgi:hypothetical protein
MREREPGANALQTLKIAPKRFLVPEACCVAVGTVLVALPLCRAGIQ